MADPLVTGDLAAPVVRHRWAPTRDRDDTSLALVVAVGFVLRLAWLAYALRAPVGEGDAQFYLRTAQHLADGEGFVGASGQATALWPPGYSFVLAVPIWIVEETFVPGGVIGAGAALNLILGTATIAVVGLVGRRLIGAETALVAALLVALFPSLIMFTAAMLSETLFTFLVAAVVAILAWTPWRADGLESVLPSSRRFVVAGLLAGFAVLVRPTFVPSVVLIPIAIFLTCRDLRRTLRISAALLVPLVAVVLPWTTRNISELGAFVPISTNTGYNLCIGHNPEATGGYNINDYCFGGLPMEDTTAAEVERDRVTAARGRDWLMDHPIDEVRLVALRTYHLFSNDSSAVAAANSYGNDPWMSVRDMQLWGWVSDAYFFGVLALAMLGWFAWRTPHDKRKLMIVLVVAGVVLATWPFFGDARFKVPMLPLLALFAAVPFRLLRRGDPVSGVADAAGPAN